MILTACGASRAEPADAPQESLGVQATRAVDRGVVALRKRQTPDGSFQGDWARDYPVGETALAVYALLKSQMPADDPAIAKAIAFLRSRQVLKTYEAATLILALSATKDPANDEAIRSAARWIEERVDKKDGTWAYPLGPNADYAKTDLSNTQYAALGLYAAEAHGHRASRDLWTVLAKRLPEYQTPSGSFRYSTNRGSPLGTGAMTTAGITVLTLALGRVSGNDRDKPYVGRASKALADAWAWLDRRFTADSDLEGDHAFRTNGHLYYLYGIERIAALAGRARIAGRDWYAEGARRLVEMQGSEGLWSASTVDTCFALLFLRKATSTVTFAPATESGTASPPRKSAFAPPHASVPYVTRWLLLGPFGNADDAGLSTDSLDEDTVAPRAGEVRDRRTWTLHRSPDPFVSFTAALRVPGHSISYAFAYLHAQRDTDVVLWFGHDDGARVVLDGRVVHERHFHEAADESAHAVPARLSAGRHTLLFKVEEWEAGRSGFLLRITRPDGSDATEVIPSTALAAPTEADVLRLRPEGAAYDAMLRLLPVDPNPTLDFRTADDLDRVVVRGAWPGYPRWGGRPEPRAKQPHPGATGFLALHPRAPDTPAQLVRRLRLPPGRPFVRIVVSGDPFQDPSGASDCAVRVLLFDGAPHVLSETVVVAGPPSREGWKTLDVDLRAHAGKDVLLIVEVAGGGKVAFHNEDAFFDEITVGSAVR